MSELGSGSMATINVPPLTGWVALSSALAEKIGCPRKKEKVRMRKKNRNIVNLLLWQAVDE
ncbi:hypothetical protein [Sodalis praecaptivus]|uniref:hypothetical protein n=1 Tax=Sodalis praecaptivus TaxID=1239307 RepID=UPI00130D9FC8|nr:hypothetical protein [Sodalis praecaptivus]